MVTAETAVCSTVLVGLALSLLWGIAAMTSQLRCVDAAGAGARAAARGESPSAVVSTVRKVAPRKAGVRQSSEGTFVRVQVTATVPGPLPLRLRAEAVAHEEGAAR